MILDSLFKPHSVAVIGASSNPGKLGYLVVKNIIDGGFAGDVYPVNPKGESVLNLKTYTSVDTIPQSPELAVVAVPAALVSEVLESCGATGVKIVIVISAGFGELGADGVAAERQLAKTCQRYGMRLLGPNCLGLVDPISKLNASFAGTMPSAGSVAVLSQSGAMCTAILDWAKVTGTGFSAFVSVGNKPDINEADLLQRWAEDEVTKVVVGYLEGISDGQRFLAAASALTRRKPFVLIKAGASAAGAAAVSSHTGAVTGADDVLDAALAKAGVIRARTIEDVFDYTLAFSHAPLPQGRRIAVVTNAGGPAVLATDAVIGAGLEMARFSERTEQTLAAALPAESNVHNPIDCIGDARAARYQIALTTALADREVDAAVVLLTPQAMTEIEGTADVIIAAAKDSQKPVIASYIGGAAVARGVRKLEQAGVAVYPTPERAVAALAALVRFGERLSAGVLKAPKAQATPAVARKAIDAALATGQAAIAGEAANPLLEAYGVPTPHTLTASTAEGAVQAAEQLGYPIVMKIDSPDILHKSDVGGVLLGLADAAAVRDGYASMLKTVQRHQPDARIKGVQLVKQLQPGHDVLVGGKRDATFGPVVVFGYGGIYVEVFKDVAFGLPPLNEAEVTRMIDATKSAALLRGTRGESPADVAALTQAIIGLSRLLGDFPQISEIDLNPLRVFNDGDGVLAIDARIIL